MLFSVFIVCSINLGIAAILLFSVGSRAGFASRVLGVALGAVGVFVAGYLAALWWALPAAPVEASEAFVFLCVLVVAAARGVWNPFGQYFFASFIAAALAYLGFAVEVTVASNFSVIGSAASALLFLLELAALAIAATFAFETCDVVCRVRHSREFPAPDPSYRPKVSIHIAAYNEPPEMLIQAIKAAEQLDYPDFEIVVVDNNTSDPDVWQPVEAYCADKAGVKFVHVDPWPGYKSGALNLALERYVDPKAEIIGVVDSDYLVDPNWLNETVGYFADPELAFVQTPQDYREFEGNRYLTACYDAYRYFFASAMPSRNERNSIIFAGTMGLLRRAPLVELGGWDEWCITEDAETSLRLLMAGLSGLYIAQSYGRGIMPLSFSSLKSQRFRWCFGGMQILRRHWKSLLPWSKEPGNQLTAGQRIDYLIGGLQWTNDLILLGFTLVLTIVGALLLTGSSVAIRPLIGPTILLPATLLTVGLLRAIWALRKRTRISYGRALLAFINWLSLSWTVALACMQGLVRREGVFMRTPKSEGDRSFLAVLASARTELLLMIVMWGIAGALAATTNATWLLIGLLAWQGSVYASAPVMSWLDQHEHLTPELERSPADRIAARATCCPRPAGGAWITWRDEPRRRRLCRRACAGCQPPGQALQPVRDAATGSGGQRAVWIGEPSRSVADHDDHDHPGHGFLRVHHDDLAEQRHLDDNEYVEQHHHHDHHDDDPVQHHVDLDDLHDDNGRLTAGSPCGQKVRWVTERSSPEGPLLSWRGFRRHDTVRVIGGRQFAPQGAGRALAGRARLAPGAQDHPRRHSAVVLRLRREDRVLGERRGLGAPALRHGHRPGTAVLGSRCAGRLAAAASARHPPGGTSARPTARRRSGNSSSGTEGLIEQGRAAPPVSRRRPDPLGADPGATVCGQERCLRPPGRPMTAGKQQWNGRGRVDPVLPGRGDKGANSAALRPAPDGQDQRRFAHRGLFSGGGHRHAAGAVGGGRAAGRPGGPIGTP